MGDLVELEGGRAAGEERAAAVEAALDELEAVRAQLIRAAMRVACAGVWREWDQRMPVGSQTRLGVGSFAGCGDPVAEALARLAGEVEDRSAEIEAAARGGARWPRRACAPRGAARRGQRARVVSARAGGGDGGEASS